MDALKAVAATGRNPWEAVQMAKELQPDLILMDIGLPKAEWNGSGETDTQARTPHKTSIR